MTSSDADTPRGPSPVPAGRSQPDWLAVLSLVVLLAVLDVARAYAGPSLKPLQWVGGAGLIAALVSWRRARGQRLREMLPLLALTAFLFPTYLDHSRNLESDGILYYSYLRSVLFDRDLDLHNDFAVLGWTPYYLNVLAVGAPIFWSPFILIVHIGREAARLFGLAAPDGTEPLYQATACLATLAYGAAGLYLLMGTLRQWASPAAAFWATVVCWVGSPLRFYLSVLPGLAHGVEFFAAVLVLRTYLSLRARPEPSRAAWAGAACGLAFLARSQDGLLLALPGIELGLRLLAGPGRRRIVLCGLAALGAFALVASPQILVWQSMFGVPFLIPHRVMHGSAFLHLDHPQLWGTLVSPRGGLFSFHPAMLLAAMGLVVLAFRDARYVLAALPVLLAGWYVNSTVFDWYHVRRFTGMVPLLAPGLAVVLTPLAGAGVLLMALLAFLALRYDQAVDGLRALPGDPAPVRALLNEVSDGLARDGYRLMVPVAPVAAVKLLDSYTGEALLDDVATQIDLGRDTSLLRLPERAHHLSEPTVEDGVACRWVRDLEARIFLPLAVTGEVVVSVRARPLETREPQVMEAFWNEASVGRSEMAVAWQEYRFHVPAASVRLGTNVLALRFDRAPIFRRTRGYGPHEIRPAALAAITLHRSH